MTQLGLLPLLQRTQRRRQGGHVGVGVLNQQIEKQIEMGRLDERFVALKIEDQIGVELAGDFGDAIGAAGMIAARANDVAAETLHRRDDARIVRGDDDVISLLRLAGAFVDVLHEILAGLPQQRFAGQTAGSIASGDDDGGFHADLLVRAEGPDKRIRPSDASAGKTVPLAHQDGRPAGVLHGQQSGDGP